MKGAAPPKTPTELSLQEQAILANIQELQRQLWKVKTEQEKKDVEETRVPDTQKIEPTRRVIIVANRLPVTGKRDEKTGTWDFRMSSGGLVTALKGCREELKAVWIGWLGQEIPASEQLAVRERLLRDYNAVPVFISDELAAKYYNGFSNDVLWPMFHYIPLPMYQAEAHQAKRFDNALWEAYKEANVQFADVIGEVLMEGDYVWVHDYHLMWLPYELRQRFKNANIGWFLHTPFPSSEIYRILPVRKALLEALLCSDLLGFHTYDYARHFLSACQRVLESDTTPRGLEYNSHFTALGVFPIGIDPEHIAAMLTRPAVHSRIKELTDRFAGRKVLLGVDRLDYIKGMPHKLLALEQFLTRFPEWRGKVTLIQVGVPSRTEVLEYQRLAERVNELVGRINGTFGTLEYAPVHYINQSISQEELVAIYNIADVCLVTSLRDGMNLVSYEYVAAQLDLPGVNQKDGPGMLVLSEFAGSAQSLSGAIRVNPWNTEEVCLAIQQALTLSRAEREIRQHKLSRYVAVNTAAFWAKSFVQELRTVCSNKPNLSKLPKLPFDAVKAAYEQAQNRLIVADYDGTLTQLQSVPQLATPSPYIINLLGSLSKDPRNTVVIVSGREKRFMDTWLGKLKIGLAAEYGFYYRMPDDDEWQTMVPEIDTTWRDIVRPILEYFTERTPGTYIEKKESSLTWHYRDADPNFGSWQAKDMQIQLEDVLSNLPLEIIQGNRMLEVRHQGASKGMVVEGVLRYLLDTSNPKNRKASMMVDQPVDFVFCVGDDRTDEDMFQVLRNLQCAANASAADPLTTPGAPVPPLCLGIDMLTSLSGGSPVVPAAPPTADAFVFSPAGVPVQKHYAHLMDTDEDDDDQEDVLNSVALHANRKSLGELSGLGVGVGVGRPRALPRDDSGDLLLGQSPPNNPPLSPGSGGAQSEPQTPLLSLEAEVFSVHVGNTHSTAEYHVDSLLEVRRLLRDFASISFRQQSRRTQA